MSLTPKQRNDREQFRLRVTGGTIKRVYNVLRAERENWVDDPDDLEVADAMLAALKQVHDDHQAEVRVWEAEVHRVAAEKRAAREAAMEGRPPPPPPWRPPGTVSAEEVQAILRGDAR